jgi:pyruvate formate lyase activating enzyme
MYAAKLWKDLGKKMVQCRLCNHFCRLAPEEYGMCGVRLNKDGSLYSLVYDKVAAINLDPVEKKPLYHFQPGSYSLSIGTVGCNFSCQFCQNDSLSQGPKVSHSISGQEMRPEYIVQLAQHNGASSISYTYSEPTIFFELMYDTAQLAKDKGIKNIMVSNGFMSTSCLEELAPYVDAINVDLKAFRDDFYKHYCGASLKPVCNNLKKIVELGWWLEVTTLVIPGLNDDEQELRDVASFVFSELGPDVPWHISRFHPAYKMSDHKVTPMASLEKAYEIGKQKGLKYVYLGNISGHSSENTLCPNCNHVVIGRKGFSMTEMGIKNNRCFHCGEIIAGVDLG